MMNVSCNDSDYKIRDNGTVTKNGSIISEIPVRIACEMMRGINKKGINDALKLSMARTITGKMDGKGWIGVMSYWLESCIMNDKNEMREKFNMSDSVYGGFIRYLEKNIYHVNSDEFGSRYHQSIRDRLRLVSDEIFGECKNSRDIGNILDLSLNRTPTAGMSAPRRRLLNGAAGVAIDFYLAAMIGIDSLSMYEKITHHDGTNIWLRDGKILYSGSTTDWPTSGDSGILAHISTNNIIDDQSLIALLEEHGITFTGIMKQCIREIDSGASVSEFAKKYIDFSHDVFDDDSVENYIDEDCDATEDELWDIWQTVPASIVSWDEFVEENDAEIRGMIIHILQCDTIADYQKYSFDPEIDNLYAEFCRTQMENYIATEVENLIGIRSENTTAEVYWT